MSGQIEGASLRKRLFSEVDLIQFDIESGDNWVRCCSNEERYHNLPLRTDHSICRPNSENFGLFRFKYSAILVDCAPTLSGDEASAPTLSACTSQAGMCDDGERTGNTIACFGYPKERFKDKPTFIAATFFVAEIDSAKTKKTCLKAPQDWKVAGSTTVNGVSFVVFDAGERNWLGGSQMGPIFRAFQDDKCFELGLQTAMEHGGYDPEVLKRFTKQDDDEVKNRLKQALDSFTFTK